MPSSRPTKPSSKPTKPEGFLLGYYKVPGTKYGYPETAEQRRGMQAWIRDWMRRWYAGELGDVIPVDMNSGHGPEMEN